LKRLLASIAPAKIKRAFSKKKKNMPLLDYDLTRFDEQDIILESEAQIQEFLPIFWDRHWRELGLIRGF